MSNVSDIDTRSGITKPVVIFDGVCGLCNHSVDFIIKRDKKKRFVFAPNQSSAAQSLLETGNISAFDVDTIYLYDNGEFYDKSTAVLRIASDLPWPWKAASVGRFLPRAARDGLYGFVATNRYRWFGKHETCRIPTPEERSRFLP